MISIKNVTFKVEKKVIVNDVTCEIPKGKITTIIGPNGCGKSSLIKSIAGINKITKGEIIVDGKNRFDYGRKEFAKKVAFMLQFNSALEGMTVYDLVTYGRYPYKKRFKSLDSTDYDKIDWAIEVTNLNNYKERDISTLSGGEKQRVWLAMCLAQEPEVLILDEPTNHLDIKYQYSFLKLIEHLNETLKLTVVLVLHDIDQAARFSEYLIIMKKGVIYQTGTPEECITSENLKKVYEVEANVKKDEHIYIRIN